MNAMKILSLPEITHLFSGAMTSMSFLANPYSWIYHYKEEVPDYIGEFRKQLGLDK